MGLLAANLLFFVTQRKKKRDFRAPWLREGCGSILSRTLFVGLPGCHIYPRCPWHRRVPIYQREKGGGVGWPEPGRWCAGTCDPRLRQGGLRGFGALGGGSLVKGNPVPRS